MSGLARSTDPVGSHAGAARVSAGLPARQALALDLVHRWPGSTERTLIAGLRRLDQIEWLLGATDIKTASDFSQALFDADLNGVEGLPGTAYYESIRKRFPELISAGLVRAVDQYKGRVLYPIHQPEESEQ